VNKETRLEHLQSGAASTLSSTESESTNWTRRRIARTLTITLVLLIFLGIARIHGNTLASTPRPFGFQGKIAEGFWHGNVEVGTAPAALLALADSYDPVQNARFRNEGLHDFALYDGKIYAPFGPTPAVVLHLPYKLFGLGYLNSRLATLLCIAVGFLACAGVIRRSVDRWAPQTPVWVESLAIFCFGVGTSLPFQIWIGGWYEVSIACGFMCVAVAVWGSLRALGSSRHRLWWFFLASVAVGLAIGSRPHLAVAALVLFVTALVVVRSEWGRAIPWSSLAALFLPMIVIGLLLLLYNQARFGSAFEFGTRYQLAGVNMRQYPIGKLAYIPANVGDYLFSGPRFDSTFPFVYLLEPRISADVAVHSHEWISGLVTSFPWVVLGLGVYALSFEVWRRTKRELLVGLSSLAVMGVLSMLAVSVTFNSSTMRYLVDFVPWLALVAAVSLAVALGSKRFSVNVRPAVIGLWSVTLLWSCYSGLAFAVVNCKSINYC